MWSLLENNEDGKFRNSFSYRSRAEAKEHKCRFNVYWRDVSLKAASTLWYPKVSSLWKYCQVSTFLPQNGRLLPKVATFEQFWIIGVCHYRIGSAQLKFFNGQVNAVSFLGHCNKMHRQKNKVMSYKVMTSLFCFTFWSN